MPPSLRRPHRRRAWASLVCWAAFILGLAVGVLASASDGRSDDGAPARASAASLLKHAATIRSDPAASTTARASALDALADAAGLSLDADAPETGAFDPGAGVWPGLTTAGGGAAEPLAQLSAALSDEAWAPAAAAASARLRRVPAAALPSLALALSARAAQAGHPASLFAAGVRAASGAVAAAAARDWRNEMALPPGAVRAGVLSLSEPDWPAALAHLYFAAAANDTLAQMALGARHAAGAGVPRSCAAAVLYYDPPARAALAAARSPGGLPPLSDRGPRLGGYRGGGGLSWGARLPWGGWAGGGGGGPWAGRGRGSGWAARLLSGRGASARRPSRAQEILHYQWFADQGNVDAARALGRLLASGGGGGEEEGVQQAAAAGYLRRAADAGDPSAAAALGHMAAAGVPAAGLGGAGPAVAALPAADGEAPPPRPTPATGSPASPAALAWFRRGAERGHPSALYGLGYLHLAGVGGAPADARKALAYFTAAAEGGSAEAWFHLGVMHTHGWGLAGPSPSKARHYFSLASRVGHVLAQYNLAMLHLSGAGAGGGGSGGGGEGGAAASPASAASAASAAASTVSPADCARALSLLQRVAERGPALAGELKAGAAALAAGDVGAATSSYLRAAEAGSELGAANAAWLLARAGAAPPGAETGPVPPAAGPRPAAAALALRLWQRAAAAGNTDALLRLGDAAFSSSAAPPPPAPGQVRPPAPAAGARPPSSDAASRAATLYAAAAKARSPQAAFNLGWMHAVGAGGLPPDAHLAKRYFDRASSLGGGAAGPVAAARAWLSWGVAWAEAAPRLPAWVNAVAGRAFGGWGAGGTLGRGSSAGAPRPASPAPAPDWLDGPSADGAGGGARAPHQQHAPPRAAPAGSTTSPLEGLAAAVAAAGLWAVVQRRRARRARLRLAEAAAEAQRVVDEANRVPVVVEEEEEGAAAAGAGAG